MHCGASCDLFSISGQLVSFEIHVLVANGGECFLSEGLAKEVSCSLVTIDETFILKTMKSGADLEWSTFACLNKRVEAASLHLEEKK